MNKSLLKGLLPLMAMGAMPANATTVSRAASSSRIAGKKACVQQIEQGSPTDRQLKQSSHCFSAFSTEANYGKPVSSVDNAEVLAFLEKNQLLRSEQQHNSSLSGDTTSATGRKDFLSCTYLPSFYDTQTTCEWGGHTWIGDNSAPTDIALDSNSINGGSTDAGAVVGGLSTTDADGGDTHTYSLVGDGTSDNGSCGAAGDDHNASFQIDNTNDELETALSLSAGSYNACVQTHDGAASYQESFTVTVVDDVAPSFENATPSVSSITVSGATVTADLNEDGTVYYVAVADGAGAPSVSEVKAEQDSGGGAPLAGGNFATSATTGSQAFDGLSGGTAYDVYVVAEDDEGIPNMQSAATKVDFTTVGTLTKVSIAADSTEPGVTTSYTFSYTTQLDVTSSDAILYTYFPAGYDFTGADCSNIEILTVNGSNVACLSLGNWSNGIHFLRVDQTVNGGSDIVVKVSGVTNPSSAGDYSFTSGSRFFRTANGSGHPIDEVTSLNFTVADGTPPNVASVAVPPDGTYATGDNLDITVNTDENLSVNTDGGTPRIALTVGESTRYATYLSGSGTSAVVFRHTAQAGDGDSDGIAVAESIEANGGTLRDAAGNDLNLTLNAVGSTASVLVDAIAPTVGSVGVPVNDIYVAGQNLDFTLYTSENLTVNTGVGVPRIALTVGATTRYATYLSGSGSSALVFRHTLQQGDNDSDGIDVAASIDLNSGTARDAAGNDLTPTLNAIGATGGVLVDTAAPSITGSQPDGSAGAADASVDFGVSFDETVVNLYASGFVLATTGSASGTVDSLSASSGDSITVTVIGISGEGTLRLDYNGTTATDAAGNALVSFTGGTTHTVDTDAPDAPAVSFDQNPVNAGNADSVSLTLENAETGATANYTLTSDGGGTAVTGSATITATDQTLSGINVSGLGDGTLTAEVTLTDDAGNISSAGTATVAKDADAPAVNSVEATDGNYAEGDTLVVVVELNEDVTVSGSDATLQIDIGPNTRAADYVSEVDGVLQFSYTVQADDNTDGNGVTVLASSLTLNGITIRDGVGNDADLSFASHSNANAQVDTNAPSVPTLVAPDEPISVNNENFPLAGTHDEDGITVEFFADANEDGTADDSTVLASATVDNNSWLVEYTLTQNAENHLVAIARDAAGNTSTTVSVPTITHDNIAPEAPADLSLATESDSGADDSDGITYITTVDISGTAEAGAILTLSSDRDGDVGATTADNNGDWTLTTEELGEGEHALTVVATDAAGNTGAASDVLSLTIDTTAPTLSDIADQSAPAGQSTGALALQLNDDLTAPTDLQLSATSSDTDSVPEGNITLAGTDSERTVEVTPAQPGNVTITLEAEDLAGNRATTSFLIGINTPPTIGGTPPATAVEGQRYEFVPSASDADGDTLAFSIAGQPSWLSFDAETGALSGTPTQGAIGQYNDIQISVTDGIASNTLALFSVQVNAGPDSDGDGVSDHQESLDGTDPDDPDDYLDNTPPELTAPADRVLNANALYTRITLAQLLGLSTGAGDEEISLALDELASDNFDGEGCCNPTVESMTDNRLLLAPGEHQVLWQAEDRKGNRTEVAQTVYLRPLMSLSKDQTTVEGNRVTFSVILNGESPFYPLTVPYVIDEAASSTTTDDHDLNDGIVAFEDGQTRVQVSLNIADDNVGEGEETLVVRLDDRTSGDEDLADGYDFDNPDIYDINRGAKSDHRIVIAVGNVEPRVVLTLEQGGERRLLIARDGGPVTATAEVIDPNAGDSHELDWSESDNVLTDTDGDNSDETFEFDPVELNPGLYSLALRATDSAGETGSGRRHFVVVPAPPVLSEEEDRNNNGLSDAEEGAGDENDNGIPDYRDNAPSPNVLPEEANGTPDYLMECDAGVVCGLGRFSLLGDTGGSRLTDEDIEGQDGLEPDTSHEPVGGVFDFEVNELPETGQSVSITIPLREPVPLDAVYRKYVDGQWRDFVEDEFNQLHSAAGDPGYCPPPGDNAWQEGLAEGHHCVQVTLEDGGPNDADGEANGAVADPGAVSRPTDDPDESEVPGEDPDEDPDQPNEPGAEEPGYDGEVTTRSSGSGSTGAWVILSLLGLGLVRLRRLDRRLGALIGVPLLSLALMGIPPESVAEEVDPIADMRFELGLYNADSSVSAGDFTRRMAGSEAPVILSQYDVSRRAISLGVEFPLAHEFSLTVGYLNLGKAQARFHTQVDSHQRLQQALEQHYPYSTKGWTLGKKLRLPLNEQVNLLAEVGLYRWHSNLSAIGPVIEQESTEGTDPLLGLGLEVPLNQRVSAGLTFKRVFFDNQRVDLMGATLNWRF